MRFLLHPQKTAVSSILAASTKRGGTNDKNRHKIPPFDGYTAVSKSLYEASAAASPPSTATAATAGGSSSSSSGGGGTTAKKAWGQQCSPTCGCVVRFEATYREGGEGPTAMHRPVLSASYRAKTVVTTAATSAASEGASESSPPALLRPALTSNGRPMLRACTCPSLHALASAAVEHMTDRRGGGGTMRRLSSQLEFASTRSSPSFRSAALRAQGFDPREHSHCFDVVEEAYTALLRGYLPRARKHPSPQQSPNPYYATPGGTPDGGDADEREDERERAYYSPYEYDPDVGIVPSSSTRRTASPYRFWSADDCHDDDDEEEDGAAPASTGGGGGGGVFGTPFSWKQGIGGTTPSKNHRTVPRPMESALRMFDDQQERERQELEQYLLATQLGRTRRIPTDWVSYVDEQQSTTTTANYYNNHSNSNSNEEPQSTSSM